MNVAVLVIAGRPILRAVRRGFFVALVAMATAHAPAFAGPDDGLLPRSDLLEHAVAAYRRASAGGVLRSRFLTVIDYSLPSWERRLWVLDPSGSWRVLFHEYVAHGRGSASDDEPDYAVSFGNEAASWRSSLGAFLTGAAYLGQHGYSLELKGLDPGVNDKAFERRIVMHPADYVSAAFRALHGRVGRSKGCPALDPAVATAVIDRIRDGSLIYVAGGAGPQVAAVAH